jgi:hypothetical protein
MHLRVDDARQEMQARRVDYLTGIGPAKFAQLGDAAIPHPDIALAHAVVVDDGTVADDEIVDWRHRSFRLVLKQLRRHCLHL